MNTIRQSGEVVAVVGSTGFIGSKLVTVAAEYAQVVGFGRQPPAAGDKGRYIEMDISKAIDKNAFSGVDTIFHLAGYAHAWARHNSSVHHEVTVKGTRNLLTAAAESGVKRFVYFSSIKAGGENSHSELGESGVNAPTSVYGEAKRQAENLVLETGRKYGMHVCNLRLSMVYGVGMKGNLPHMIAAIDRGWFPPPPRLGNKRSMIWVGDVVRAALLAAYRLEANGKTYVVTDGHPYSTREIYEAICAALGKPVPFWAVPMPLLKAAAKLGDVLGWAMHRRFVFDSEALQKLSGSAFYSSAEISRELEFTASKKLFDVLNDIVMDFRVRDVPRR